MVAAEFAVPVGFCAISHVGSPSTGLSGESITNSRDPPVGLASEGVTRTQVLFTSEVGQPLQEMKLCLSARY